jgi:HD-GYP domain-containing protein (c-di-GMP phosphodiesterase class II)
MGDCDGLRARILALRQRLEQAQGLLRDVSTSLPAAELAEQLQRDVSAGTQVQSVLEGTLRQMTGPVAGEDKILPTQLTARARALLERGRGMVQQLRKLADDPNLDASDLDDPLVQGVRRTSSMVEAAVRFVQAFPDAPSIQLRLCDGLEGLLSAAAERISSLASAADSRRTDHTRIETLAHWLLALHAGRTISADPLSALAEELIAESRDGVPLRFLSAGSPASSQWLPRHVAAHGLTVAQVVARLLRHTNELAIAPESVVMAALVHDLGLLSVPIEILASSGPLADEQKRLVERHAHSAAQRLESLFSNTLGLTESVANHHERLDGSGYPAGLTGSAIASGARLLAVADVYSAIASARPHRPAADPRTALTETLLEAQRGALDSAAAERLLMLAFYPVGTVVELSDGSVARVVAVHPTRADVHAPSRPVVQLLADERGAILPHPRTLDLNQCDGRAVVRAIPVAQRRRLLTDRYPEWAA